MTITALREAPREHQARPRSVIPGRQRWDVPAIKGRPDLAEVFVAALLDYPGRMEVEANTLTGRALVLHDDALSSDDVATMVRRAAALVTPQNSSVGSRSRSRPAAERDGPGSRRPGLLVAVGGMAVGALGALVGSPLLSLVGIVGSSLLIIRQGWREAAARQGKTSRRSTDG